VLTKSEHCTPVNGFVCESLRKEIKTVRLGGVQDGRSSERGDFPGAAGRPRHWLLLWPGQPRGGLAAGMLAIIIMTNVQMLNVWNKKSFCGAI